MALTDGPSGLRGVPGHMNPATVGQVGVEVQELKTRRHHGCRLHFVHEHLEDHRYSNTRVRGGMDHCHDTVAEEHAAVVGWVGHPPGPPMQAADVSCTVQTPQSDEPNLRQESSSVGQQSGPGRSNRDDCASSSESSIAPEQNGQGVLERFRFELQVTLGRRTVVRLIQ